MFSKIDAARQVGCLPPWDFCPFTGEKWARQDSNLQPNRYERSALTIELQAHQHPDSAETP